jgi:hypothetical protein
VVGDAPGTFVSGEGIFQSLPASISEARIIPWFHKYLAKKNLIAWAGKHRRLLNLLPPIKEKLSD